MAITRLGSDARKLYCRAAYSNVVFGANVHLGRHVELRSSDGGRIEFGDGVHISDFALIVAKYGSLTIGRSSFVGRGAVIVSCSEVSIGSDALIAEYVTIRDQDHDHSLPAPLRNRSSLSAPIRIGANVWLGAKATVTRGASIGDNSVIGANSVVTAAVPANVVAAGAPAVVRKATGMGSVSRPEEQPE